MVAFSLCHHLAEFGVGQRRSEGKRENHSPLSSYKAKILLNYDLI